MTSLIVTVCDGIATGLQANVTGLDTTTIPAGNLHKYEPHDPEQLQPDRTRHLAVYPVPENFGERLDEESADGFHMLKERYAVLVWEGTSEASRAKRDETGWAALLDVHEAALVWLYKYAQENLGGSELSWYAGTEFATHTGRARWFRILIDTVQGRAFA